MSKQSLLWISLIILIGLVVSELSWFKLGGLAWPIMLTVVICLQFAYILSSMKIKLFYAGFLALGVLIIFIGTKLLAPELTANEMKTIINTLAPSEAKAISADYQGQGIWEVKTATKQGWIYYVFDENVGRLIEVKTR